LARSCLVVLAACGSVKPPAEGADAAVPAAPPEVTLLTPIEGSTTGAAVQVAFSVAAPVAGVTFACSLDAAPFTSCTSPRPYTGLTDGPHSVAVRAVIGDATGPTATAHFSVDSVGPMVTIMGNPTAGAVTGGQTADFTLSSDRAGVTFECSLDAAPFAACANHQHLAALAHGDHVFRARAVASGIHGGEAAVGWSVDLVPPAIAFTAKPGDPTTELHAAFAFTVDNTAVTTTCTLDGAAVTCTGGTAAFDLTQLGLRAFAVTATDAVGNRNVQTYTWNVGAAVCVDATNGSDGAAGTCTPFAPVKHLTRGLALLQASQALQVYPGSYGAGETFPLAVPAGAVVIGDEAHKGVGPVPTVIDSVDQAFAMGSHTVLAGLEITSAATTSQRVVWLAGTTGGAIRNVTIDGGFRGVVVEAPNVHITSSVFRHQNQQGVYLSAPGAVVEANQFDHNGAAHIMLDTVIADLGGGGASAGHNVFACGPAMSWNNTAIVPARNNLWDHVPPVQGYASGNDVLILTGTAWDTTGATLNGITCP
jgi:hypothetical protein